MPLYRLTYTREGKPRKATVAQPTFELAHQWAERYVRGLGQLITLYEVASKHRGVEQLRLI